MECVSFKKSPLEGVIQLPPSKSAGHRAVLCAALSGKPCCVSNINDSEDLMATVSAVQALGFLCQYDKKVGSVTFSERKPVDACVIDCGESGSTLRFLIPIAAALGVKARFIGRGRLPQRPLGVFQELLPQHGVTCSSEGGLPLDIQGKLTGGLFSLPGNVSSQFITGLLFALPLLSEDSEIILTSPLESKGYVELTCSVLQEFGIEILARENGYFIPGGQAYQAKSVTVEGDWSQAAFYLTMAALSETGKPLTLRGLRRDSCQGDRACVEIYKGFGLESSWDDDDLLVWNPRAEEAFGGLTGQVIDASQIPDMVPALAICAAFASGETRIINAQRLRIKESDRLSAMEQAIRSIGGNISQTEDGLCICGVSQCTGGLAKGENDHRVVMALAGAACRCSGEIQVTDPWSINKSYPAFYSDYRKIGGVADVIQLG